MRSVPASSDSGGMKAAGHEARERSTPLAAADGYRRFGGLTSADGIVIAVAAFRAHIRPIHEIGE